MVEGSLEAYECGDSIYERLSVHILIFVNNRLIIRPNNQPNIRPDIRFISYLRQKSCIIL